MTSVLFSSLLWASALVSAFTYFIRWNATLSCTCVRQRLQFIKFEIWIRFLHKHINSLQKAFIKPRMPCGAIFNVGWMHFYCTSKSQQPFTVIIKIGRARTFLIRKVIFTKDGLRGSKSSLLKCPFISTKVLHSGAWVIFSLYCWWTLKTQTAAGLLGCCHFKY